jgi:hypothetical protein
MTIAYSEILITPLNDEDNYGNTFDATDYLKSGTIGNVSQTIDKGNYDIGLFTYADLNITLINFDGRFNDNTKSSSMFYYTRDRALVEVNYYDNDNNKYLIFSGIINDEATQQDLINDTVKLKVLSRDSIIRKTKVSGGLIKNGDSFLQAINIILGQPKIQNVLNYNPSNITVGYNNVIDNAEQFTDQNTRTVLDALLNASGSVFRVDKNNNMIVSPRVVTSKPALELYGGGNLLQQNNIIKIQKFNDGLQRTFNTFVINKITSEDKGYIDRFGVDIKNYTFDFITQETTSQEIGAYLLNEFKDPKNEVEITVPTNTAKDSEILDPVTVSLKKNAIGWEDKRVPIAGVAIAGSDYVPYSSGGTIFNNNKNWKITGIIQDTKKLETTLRLREV